jgi:hypothetical protein
VVPHTNARRDRVQGRGRGPPAANAAAVRAAVDTARRRGLRSARAGSPFRASAPWQRFFFDDPAECNVLRAGPSKMNEPLR